eukprot:CAMPEP_0168508808 /NCGR_PEP_ID=MMETSP0405-20121227/358_1 /TAXON_ID=498012 /ORGANISM="Trichosphaerium sp, Strain Am-I-7 wt" /LENGTH=488 /DNA_ID=CAMNT_0008526061 /DNA_START=84 /DNA_END=1550 /DNA_ORIENTATION=+
MFPVPCSYTTNSQTTQPETETQAQLEATEKTVQYWKNKYLALQHKQRSKTNAQNVGNGYRDIEIINDDNKKSMFKLVVTHLNITSYVSLWLSTYNALLYQNFAVPTKHWTAGHTIEAFGGTIQWQDHVEAVELLSVLAFGALVSGYPKEATRIHNIAKSLQKKFKDVQNPCVASGTAMIGGYICMTGDTAGGFPYIQEGQEKIELVLKNPNFASHPSTQPLGYLQHMSRNCRVFTNDFFNDRQKEIINIRNASHDIIDLVLQSENPSPYHAIFVTFATCGEIWLSISTAAPNLILERKRIPGDSMKAISVPQQIEMLHKLTELNKFAHFALSSSHVSIQNGWYTLIDFTIAFVYFAARNTTEALRRLKQVILLVDDGFINQLGQSISLCMVVDICTVAICARDGAFFLEVASIMYERYGDACGNYLSALLLLADGIGLRYSKEIAFDLIFKLTADKVNNLPVVEPGSPATIESQDDLPKTDSRKNTTD